VRLTTGGSMVAHAVEIVAFYRDVTQAFEAQPPPSTGLASKLAAALVAALQSPCISTGAEACGAALRAVATLACSASNRAFFNVAAFAGPLVALLRAPIIASSAVAAEGMCRALANIAIKVTTVVSWMRLVFLGLWWRCCAHPLLLHLRVPPGNSAWRFPT